MTKQTVLLIDNDQPWIKFVTQLLTSIYDIDVAPNVEMAQHLLDEDNYALVIVNSLHKEVLSLIKQEYPSKRLIVATNKPTPQEAIRMYDLGAVDYFPKKFSDDLSLRTKKAIKIPVIVA